MRSTRVRAFSLPELLVVIGVVAVLLSILLPALAQVRSAALRTFCLSQLRETGAAGSLRAVDCEGFLPLAGLVRTRQPTEDTHAELPAAVNDAHRRRYTYRYWATADGPQARLTLEPFQISLLPYLDGSFPGVHELGISYSQWDPFEPMRSAFPAFRLFECPDGPDQTDGHSSLIVHTGTAQWNSHFLNRWDYAFNEAVTGFDDRSGRVHGRARGMLTRVGDSSRIVLTGDALRPVTRASGVQILGVPFAWKPTSLAIDRELTLADVADRNRLVRGSAALDSRHRGRTNVLFVDGHAESLRNEIGELRRGVLRTVP